MPKILINEKDRTSPGTPDSYANFAVLITGFMGTKTESGKTIEADANGVYEFRSADDFGNPADNFGKTIGLAAPEQTDANSITTYHYGNQMAYELLKMGYSVIYKPITDIKEMANSTFWEIFKDKANYDFRFVTHGLLKSSTSGINQEKLTELKARLAEVEEALGVLLSIADLITEESNNEQIVAAKENFIRAVANNALELTEQRNNEYSEIRSSYSGFKAEGAKDPYKSYGEAANSAVAELNSLTDAIRTEENKDSGLITTNVINSINGQIADLAKYTEGGTGRGDCTALIELDETLYTSLSAGIKPESAIINGINAMSDITGDKDKGKYCTLTVPSVVYRMSNDAEDDPFKNNKKFPGAFHYLACFINSLKSGFAEWYAAAGYTRGVSGYTVDYTTVKLGEIAINALEPRKAGDAAPKFACNVIANFRGSYYLWGNRTAYNLMTADEGGDLVASHFLNIRQLCTTIKKQLYVACRRFTFDPNSDTLWFNFVNAIRPTLEAMKADQGIRDYKILKVFTDKKATLKAKIRIIPIEAVEDFDLEVSLEDSFGETAAVVTE